MRKSRFRLKQSAIIAASIQLIFANVAAWANPTGPQVVNGAATFQRPDARTLNVTNSPGSIINWQGFSIGANEITRFIQQSSSSAVLNRVVGGNISQIYGQLLSNGRLFLINPGGIVIGPGAIVDTAGFVASTLHMLDADFLAGKLKFQGDASSGSIVNQGWIRTGYGGNVILVAPQIENSGLIHTPGGELILAAGQKLTITSLDLEGVQFEVQAPTDTVVNLGKLLADGGAVGVFAGTLRHSGEIRANALVYDEAGRVVLKAQNDIQVAVGSSTSANGRKGGSVTIESTGGLTRVAGDVRARGDAGRGGEIRVLGNRVSVVENATVDVSGSAGGGQILVGGDYQGSSPDIQNSSNTFVGSGATLRADATQAGDGGRIIVWSDDKTQFYGSLSAQGGPEGGNGGFAEVSGKQGLIFAGSANLGAPKGNLGTLLLDPPDLFIFTGGGLLYDSVNDLIEFPSNAASVSPDTLAAVTGNVSLNAARYMRVSDPITLTGAGQGLTAQVGAYAAPAAPDPLSLATNTQINNIPNRLEIGANITTANGAVSLNAPAIQGIASSTIATSGGAISLSTTTGAIQASSLSLDAGAGAVTANSGSFLQLSAVTGGSFSATAPSSINTGAITTSGGAVSLTSSGSSIFASSITTGGGSVTGNAAFNISTGAITTTVASASGNVSLTGTGSSVSTGNITAGSGNVTLSGTSVSTGTIDTTSSAMLTATSGSVFATVNNASSVTASATNNFSSATVNLSSATVLNTTDVRATTTRCSTSGFCSGASITLSGDQGVNVGTVTATAPRNFVNKASFGDAYDDPRFENISESVTVIANNGPIRAMSGSSLVTAADVRLETGQLSGGGIGQLGASPLPVKVDVERIFTFRPNGEFNVELTGTGPNRLDTQVGVAPAAGPNYTGTLTKTGQITLNAAGTSDTVTASTFNISGGFDQRVFNSSPSISLRVPNGKLVANDVKVPAGDGTGTASPSARRNCDVFGGNSCPPALTIEPLTATLRASDNLQVDSYTRAAGTLAKQTIFQSDAGSTTLGTINASKDSVSASADVNASVSNLTTTGSFSLFVNTGNVTISNLTSAGASVSSSQGNISIANLNSSGSVSVSSSSGNVTVDRIDTTSGTGSVSISATGSGAGIVKAQTDGTGVEITSGGAISINATTIGDGTFANPLDLAGSTVSLGSFNGGTIGFSGKPIVANTQTLTVSAASGSTFNVTTGTTALKNLTVTASPAAVGNGGLAQVTSQSQTYSFASDGTNFTLGGTNFPAAVPAAQFAGGTLSFTSTSGNLTLNSLDFSASNGNFSATTNGNLANITQMAGQSVNLGTGTLTLKADGNVSLQSVNAGGMSASNATSNNPSGCTTFGFSQICGVTSFTANQPLTDTANGNGTWSVTSRGAINTGNLEVDKIAFTSHFNNVTTGAIGTGAEPAASVTISTTSTSAGGSIQTGAIEADSVSLTARQSVAIGTVTAPAAINATNTDAASINLSSQTSTVTVNGALNASSVTLTAPTTITTGNINAAAPSPQSIAFRSTSAVDINTGSLDAKSVVAQSACSFFYCPPGDIIVNGAIGANTNATTISLDGTNGTTLSIAGVVSLDPLANTDLFMRSSGAITLGGALTAGTGSVFVSAGTTLTGAAGNPLGAVTAGDGSSVTLQAFNSNTATPFRFTQIDAGPTGAVTVNAPAGIIETLATGSGGGIRAATVSLSATSSGSKIEDQSAGPTTPAPLTLRDTSSLTLNSDGSININRTGASGAPLLSNLNITRSDNTAGVSLAGFAAGQSVTISNDTIGGGVNVDAINTSATPLNFTYRNTDSVNGNLTVTGTGITSKGGSVFLSTTQNLTTGAIDTKSGAAMVPDGSITLQAGQSLNVSGTVDSGAAGIIGSAAGISGNGQLVSTSSNSVTLSASSGNIGTNATTRLAISAPTVSLNAFGTSPSGNIFATLTGTTDLTLNASDGFTVSSTVPLTGLNLTTQGSGTGPVSLTTTAAQSYGFVRNGTTLEVTGLTSTTPLTSFALNVQSGNLTAKGGIAADALDLSTNGTLTLDGSTTALTLSNGSQDFSGNAVVIQSNVTASATSSQSIFASTNLGFTGAGTLSSGGSQNITAFGSLGLTSQGGVINVNAVNQNISAVGNLDLTAQGGAINVQATNQTVAGGIFGGASTLTLRGGTGAGQSITLTGSGSQTIQTSDNTASSIKLLAGSGADASASIVYTGSGTQLVQGGNIVMTGGSATGASAVISTATGPQRIRATGNITLTGGTASGAVAKIENTSSNEQRVGESLFIPFCCSEPYQTDNVVLQGGTGAEAAILASGPQRIQADIDVKVLGGTGPDGKARIENTSAAVEQRIGCGASGTGESCAANLNTLALAAGANGAFAQVVAPGIQRLRGTSNLTLTGHADDGGFARISGSGGLQFIQFGNTALTAGQGSGSNAEILYSGTGVANQDSQTLFLGNVTLTASGTAGGNTAVARISSSDTRTDQNAQRISAGGVTMTGGAGPNSVAEITTPGRQNLSFFGTSSMTGGAGSGSVAQMTTNSRQDVFLGSMTMTGGSGAGSFVRINTPADQSAGFNSLTMAGGSASGTYAKIDAGGTQNVSGGNLTLIAKGTETAPVANASAIIEGHDQSFSVSNLTLTGGSGTDASNTSDAVLRNLSAEQSVFASSITLNGGHQLSTTGILNQGTGTQTVSGSSITMTSDPDAHPDASVLIQNTPATMQTLNAFSGGIRLNSGGAGSVGITSAGSQNIRSRYIDVATTPGTVMSGATAQILATGDQWIHTTGDSTTAPIHSMRVAALGAGVAKIEAGGSQLLEVAYPEVMTTTGVAGKLIVGDVNATGPSLVQATNQNVFAGSIAVQAGSGTGSLSKLSASSSQTISTLRGGIDVLGGAGANSLATIDPLTQTILSNGTVAVTGGSGGNADASIVSGGTQTVTATSGDISLTGGTGDGADALITGSGSQAILAAQNVAVLGGDGVNADASIVSGATQSITAVTGDITLTGGAGADADASIASAGAQTITAINGDIILDSGTGLDANAFITASALPQIISAAGNIELLTAGTFISNPNVTVSGPFSCTGPCTLQELLPTAPASSVLAFGTSSVLLLQEDLSETLIEITPAGEAVEILTRRAPVCR